MTEPAAADVLQTFRAEDDSTYTRYQRLAANAWRALNPDGSIYLFNEASHLLNSSGQTVAAEERRAPLTSMVDPFGNTVSYFYEATFAPACDVCTAQLAEWHLTRVEYTANPAAGLSAFARVYLDWAVPTYCTGSSLPVGARMSTRDHGLEFEGSRKLTQIRTQVLRSGTWSPVRTIALTYDPFSELCGGPHGTARLLNSIQETAFTSSGATTSRPAVSFTYGPRQRTFDTQVAFDPGSSYLHNGERVPTVPWPTLDTMLIDLDGDGRIDRLRAHPVSATLCRYDFDKNVYDAATGQTRFEWQGMRDFPSIPQPATYPPSAASTCSLTGFYSLYNNLGPVQAWPQCPQRAEHHGNFLVYRFLDMNADGLPDLVTSLNPDFLQYDPELDTGPGGVLSSWGLSATCGTAAPSCPIVDDTAVNNAIVCDHGACQFDSAAVNGLLAGASNQACDEQGGGPTIVYQQGGQVDGQGSHACEFPRNPWKHCGQYPWRWYANTNGTFNLNAGTTILSPVPLEPGSGDTNLGGRGFGLASSQDAVIDLDGDGYLDVATKRGDAGPGVPKNGWWLWRGDGSGNFLPAPNGRPYLWLASTAPGGSETTAFNDPASPSHPGYAALAGIELMDMNGDGLPDLVDSRDLFLAPGTSPPPSYAQVTTYFNSGDGFRVGTSASNPPGFWGRGSYPPDLLNSQLSISWDVVDHGGGALTGIRTGRIFPIDLDGDGRLDIFDRGASFSPYSARAYFGDGAASSYGPRALDLWGSSVDKMPQVVDATSLTSWYSTQEQVDIDGDGVVDLVQGPAQNWAVLTDQKDGKPNFLLNRIDNSVGGTIDVRYADVGDSSIRMVPPYRTKDIPQHLWVVKSMTVTNAHDAEWPGDPEQPDVTATTTYKYGDPHWSPDVRGRIGFRGFDKVEATGPSGARTRSTFDYGVDWSGRLSETDVFRGATDATADRVDTTAYGTFFLFGTTARSFLPTDTKHYTCSASQTVAQCMPASGATVLQTRTTYTAYPSSSSQMWGKTLEVMTRIPNQVSVDDKKVMYTNYPLFDANTYRFRVGVTRKQEGTLNTQGQIIWSRAAEHVDDWDATKRVVADTLDLVNDSHNAITYFSHDMATGRLTGRRKPMQASANKWQTYAYDANKLFVLTTTNELNQVVTTSYDLGTGALLSTKGPNSSTCNGAPGCTPDEETQTVIDGLGRPTEQWTTTDAAGGGYVLQRTGRTSYFDNESPQRVREEHRLDFSSNAYTQADTLFDGLGQVMQQSVSNQGAGPDQLTVFSYDSAGDVIRVKTSDPSATTQTPVTYAFAYDALGRMIGATRPTVSGVSGSASSGFAISRDGLTTTRVELADPGHSSHPAAMTITKADVFDRLIEVRESIDGSPSNLAITSYDYDGLDDLVKVTSADNAVTTLVYDYRGHRTGIVRGPRTWAYSYDDNGNLLTEVAPIPSGGAAAAYTTSYAFDHLDRVTSKLLGVRALSSADLAEFGHGITTYGYDSGPNGKGHLTTVTQYVGQTSSTTPWSTTSNTYEARGLVASVTRTLNLTAALGVAGFSDTRTQSFTYDAMGAPADVYAGDGATQTASTHTLTGYDQRGAPSSLTWYRSGTPFTVASLTRNPSGLITRATNDAQTGNWHLWQNFSRDGLGRVLTHDAILKTAAPDVQLSRETMSYYDTDDIAQLAVERQGLTSRTFNLSYDDRHQLTHADDGLVGGYAADLWFTPGGKLTTANVAVPAGAPVGTTRNASYVYGAEDPEAPSQLTQAGTPLVTYTYDRSGNVVTRADGSGTFAFVYDGDDQERRATAPTGDRDVYYYDASGTRIAEVTKSASGTIQKVRQWLGPLEAWYTGTGAVDKTWAYASLGPSQVRIENRTTLEYELSSGLGSTQGALAENATALSVAYSYGPFGEILQQSGADADHLRRFNGKEQDTLSKLDYYGFRYFDPLSVSWTQADPLYRFSPDLAYDQPRKLNLYVFSGNNPLRYMDPDGKDFGTRVSGLGKAIGGLFGAAGGVTLFAAPEPTGATKVAGAVIFAASADVAYTGVRELVSGDKQVPYFDDLTGISGLSAAVSAGGGLAGDVALVNSAAAGASSRLASSASAASGERVLVGHGGSEEGAGRCVSTSLRQVARAITEAPVRLRAVG